jgi:hypothetical protein
LDGADTPRSLTDKAAAGGVDETSAGGAADNLRWTGKPFALMQAMGWRRVRLDQGVYGASVWLISISDVPETW